MKNLSHSDKISMVSALIALLGFLLVIWQISITNEQIRKTEINQRAQFLAQLQDRAFNSNDFQEIFRKLEYEKVEINSEFHGSKEQIQMVAFLSFLEFICQLEKMGLIKFDDVKEIFGYYILRVYQSPAVIEYRLFLKDWVKQGKFPENVTFPNFEALAKRIEKYGV
ncbi:MAG: hypothetical protein K8S13_24890 [Desulfobacula sp.]|uniref:DUF4760 domain-containing protein n=1 Tax=Desulfobacula sp. TaxID=2593537 RepID=UPI0025BD6AF9|nr:hypothetical protein [Desulfobacula sp.]MCD4723068.1 hypothetical protein [Desulfobacula sp.]